MVRSSVGWLLGGLVDWMWMPCVWGTAQKRAGPKRHKRERSVDDADDRLWLWGGVFEGGARKGVEDLSSRGAVVQRREDAVCKCDR